MLEDSQIQTGKTIPDCYGRMSKTRSSKKGFSNINSQQIPQRSVLILYTADLGKLTDNSGLRLIPMLMILSACCLET